MCINNSCDVHALTTDQQGPALQISPFSSLQKAFPVYNRLEWLKFRGDNLQGSLLDPLSLCNGCTLHPNPPHPSTQNTHLFLLDSLFDLLSLCNWLHIQPHPSSTHNTHLFLLGLSIVRLALSVYLHVHSTLPPRYIVLSVCSSACVLIGEVPAIVYEVLTTA